jgi:hypothetical protein
MEKLPLEEWHKKIIKTAFSRCWGLQKLIIEAIGSEDKMLTDSLIEELMSQTAFSKKLINDNLKEISEL